MYISFFWRVDEMADTIPEGWKKQTDCLRCTIPEDCQDVEGFKDRALSDLMRWIESLPKWKWRRKK